MLDCFGANLHEILQVRGSPLKENELWTLLRVLSSKLVEVTIPADCSLSHASCFIAPERVVLLPNGRIHFTSEERNETDISSTLYIHLKENTRWKPKTFQVYSFGLTILWCAEYGLKQCETIAWSSELQQLVTSMCDETKAMPLQSIYNKSHKHKNINSADDLATVIELSESIIGDMMELSTFSEHLSVNESTSTSIRSLGDDHSSSSFEETPPKLPLAAKIDAKPTSKTDRSVQTTTPVSTSTKLNAQKPFQDKTNKPSVKSEKVVDQLPSKMKIHKSVLSSHGISKHLDIGASSFSNVQLCFLLTFPDRSQASVKCGQVGMVQILRSALDSWIYGINQQHFALAYWEESEYHFFQTFAELQAKVKSSKEEQVFYLRILYFPPNTTNLDANLTKAMYLQLRIDLLDERITCMYEDAMSVAALALQHEFGDYKQEYRSDYFSLSEFVPMRVITQLGATHVCQQVAKLHRQLAGIGRHEASILFLRRCSNFEEYGMNFHKTYRLKSCKNENCTWLGVGPRGIAVFDLKNNNSRMKRHFLNWTDLKKMNCKNRKISFSVINPEMKLKFYQKMQKRANYLLTVIGKLHQFYSSQKPSRKISSIGLFDDITRLPSSTNLSPVRDVTDNTPASAPRTPLQACFTSSSIDQYKSQNGSRHLSVPSTSSTSSIRSSDKAVLMLSPSSSTPSIVTHDRTQKIQSSTPQATPSHFVRSFRTVRRPSSGSSSSASTQRKFKLVSTSTPVLSDAKGSWSVPSDEYLSPVTRKGKSKVTITKSESGSFSDQNGVSTSEVTKVKNDSIHKAARDYYRTSLSSGTDVSNNSGSQNGSIPSTTREKYKEDAVEHIYDDVAEEQPSSSRHSDSFSSNCITFYHSDSSNL